MMYDLAVLAPDHIPPIAHIRSDDLRRLIATAVDMFGRDGIWAVAITDDRHVVVWWLDITCTHPDTPADDYADDPDDYDGYAEPM